MNDNSSNLSRLMEACLKHLERDNSREIQKLHREFARRPVLRVIPGGKNE